MIQGGTASNVVPENVAAHFNIRLTETYEDQEKFIQEVIKKVESYDGKITKTMT